MIKNLTLFIVLLTAGILLAGCGSGGSNTTATNATTNGTTTVAETTSKKSAGSLADPKSSISYQFDLVKSGDAEMLKTCMTPRVRDGVTKEVVDKAKTDAAKYTMEDLYDTAEMGEADGKKTAKVKMKNGRTLTTLIETDGKWLADTVWFK